jgi:RNA-binding protein 39
VYVKCPSIAAAIAAVNALHGRWFAGKFDSFSELLRFLSEDPHPNIIFFFFFSPITGKMITAAYVPLPTYHNLFPDSMTATQLLVPSRR